MRVYCDVPEHLSRGLRRVAEALKATAPAYGFEAVSSALEAELVVVHAVGYGDTEAAIKALTAAGKRYAIVQYCLRTTQEPDTAGWLEMWAGAHAVWSYYDLEELMAEDGVSANLPLYDAPLGVDGRVFYPRLIPSPGRLCAVTSGYVAETESIREAARAARRAGRRMYHLGPDLRLGPHVERGLGITDQTLAEVYSRADYVLGLRRVEGFELPAAEGLLCGARPVLFDRDHYRRHFGDWAVYVNEAPPAELEEELLELFGYEPAGPDEADIAEARRYFSWPRVCGGFWRKVLEELDVEDIAAAAGLGTEQPRGDG